MAPGSDSGPPQTPEAHGSPPQHWVACEHATPTPRQLFAGAGRFAQWSAPVPSVTHAPFAAPQHKIRLEHALRVDSKNLVSFLDYAVIDGVALGSSPDDGAIYLALVPAGLTLNWREPSGVGSLPGTYLLDGGPALGSWAGRWGFEVDIDKKTVQGLHDGQPHGDPQSLPKGAVPTPGDPLGVGLGVVSASLGAALVTVAYDDVLGELA